MMWYVYVNKDDELLVCSDMLSQESMYLWKLVASSWKLEDLLTSEQLEAYAGIRLLPEHHVIPGVGERSGMYREGVYLYGEPKGVK